MLDLVQQTQTTTDTHLALMVLSITLTLIVVVAEISKYLYLFYKKKITFKQLQKDLEGINKQIDTLTNAKMSELLNVTLTNDSSDQKQFKMKQISDKYDTELTNLKNLKAEKESKLYGK